MNDFMEEIFLYSKNTHLLYVEDNEQARLFTLELLSRFFDNITIAKDGEEGLKTFRENKIDLIITDVNMPKMNGLEMCSHIRAINNNVTILMLSAHNENGVKETSYNTGVDEYLEKPLNLKELIEVLKELALTKSTRQSDT